MKLEVGMYVRLDRNQGIAKIDEYDEENNIYSLDKYIYDEYGDGTFCLDTEDVIKASYNLIDLIELGDYVNGLVVTRICFDGETSEKYLNMYGSVSEWNNEDIKSIVTKEQFNSMKYEVGE